MGSYQRHNCRFQYLFLATFGMLRAISFASWAVSGQSTSLRRRTIGLARFPAFMIPAAIPAAPATTGFCSTGGCSPDKTTDAEDQLKAQQLRREADSRATASDAHLAKLATILNILGLYLCACASCYCNCWLCPFIQHSVGPSLDLMPFKDVLLRATAASGQQKYLVRGTSGAAYHRDVALPYVKSYMKDGFGIEVLGGGRILHDTQRGFIQIYGFSYGFPWVEGAGHEISAEVCRQYFSGYEATELGAAELWIDSRLGLPDWSLKVGFKSGSKISRLSWSFTDPV
ncbi:unnamed protein product [Durusdinium trenchii]|uniref:Uncharacterized protein n=2 Tax=Durusdinium trenchii TaxID=1381693 RepID=A0ABP0RJB1_9DINO